MAFGQQIGPPATARQMQDLLALLREAGWEDLREARHPLGLTQRQAGGKFTRDEATELIDRLQPPDDGAPLIAAAETPRTSAEQQVLKVMSAAHLAAELERRGWVVIAP